MSSVDGTVEVESPIESHTNKYLDLLPIFDKLEFDTTFRLSDSSMDDMEVSDNDSLPEGYADDLEGLSEVSTLEEEIPAQPNAVPSKALKVLGQGDALPSSSGPMAPKAMKVLGMNSPKFSFPSLPLKRQSLAKDSIRSRESKLNLAKARQLWSRPNSSSISSHGDELKASHSRTDSSNSSNVFTSSERSSRISCPENPEDALGLRAQLDYASILRARKLMEEHDVAQANLNKPLPRAPRKQDQIYQSTSRGSHVEQFPDTDVAEPSTNVAGQVLYHELTTTQGQQAVDTPQTSKSSPRMGSPRKHVAQLMQNGLTKVKTEGGRVLEGEGVALKIFLCVDSLDDMAAIAMVNKSFYNAFKRHETLIISRAVLVSSPAAWELRQSMSHPAKPSPFRMKSVRRDITSVQALEAFIVMRCRPVCRPETVQALLGGNAARKIELEDALWRIWTFCKLFGKGSGVEADFARQVTWLNGGQQKSSTDPQTVFGVGNGTGVSMRELEDMSEMWRCMENLLAGFRGREEDARRAGLFDRCTITDHSAETYLLENWIHDMLSLGPKAVLTLSSCDFDHAKVLGLTNWNPPVKGQNRQNFFKAAVEEAYRERLVVDAQRVAREFKTSSFTPSHKRSASDSAVILPAPIPHRLRPPIQEQGLKIETSRPSSPEGKEVCEEQPEPSTAIKQNVDPLSPSMLPSASAATNPMAFSSISLARNASTRLGSSLFPTHPALQSPEIAIVAPPPPPRNLRPLHNPEIVDPTDKAIHKLVHEMGFAESEAKHALATSDTGVGIDVERAIEILSANRFSAEKEAVELPSSPSASGPRNLSSQNSQRAREYCEGTCPTKTVIIAEPKRDRVQGLGRVRRNMSVRKSIRKMGGSLSMARHEDSARSGSGSATSQEAHSNPDFPSAVQTQSFRENGGGLRTYMSGALNPRFSHPPTTQSTSDLLQVPTKLTPLEELPSPSSVYSDTEAYAWPSGSSNNGNAVWGALAAGAPSATPQSVRNSNSSYGESSSSSPQSSQPHSPSGSPRVTLTRVGTGKSASGRPRRFASVRRNGGNPRAMKREEIIGYAY